MTLRGFHSARHPGRLACCLCSFALLAACGGASPSVSSAPSAPEPSSLEETMDLPYQSRVLYAGSYDAMPGEIAFAGAVTDAGGLESFAVAHQEDLSPEGLEALADYGGFDFEQQALVIAAIDGASGSDRYTVTRVAAEGGTLSVTVELEPPESGMMGTTDLARFLIVIEIPAAYGSLPLRVNGGTV